MFSLIKKLSMCGAYPLLSIEDVITDLIVMFA